MVKQSLGRRVSITRLIRIKKILEGMTENFENDKLFHPLVYESRMGEENRHNKIGQGAKG